MITSYILINIENITPSVVAEELTLIEGVENVHQTKGSYELIARVVAENEIELREQMLEEMKKVRGIVSLNTLVVSDYT